MEGWCKERYNKDENNKLEGLHQKPDQMEETRWEAQNFSEVVAPQEEEEGGYYLYLPPFRDGWAMASHWVWGYSPETVYVGSLLVRVVPSRFFCEHFDFTLPVTIPPVFHTLLLLSLRCTVSPVSQNIITGTFVVISHLPCFTWNLAEEVI